MQDMHSQQLEVGDLVLIDWPRTRWDHRRGRLHELRQEPSHEGYGFVLLDCIAVRFSLERLRRT